MIQRTTLHTPTLERNPLAIRKLANQFTERDARVSPVLDEAKYTYHIAIQTDLRLWLTCTQ